jgi:hypothetical protein
MLTSLEGLFEAGNKTLGRNIRYAVSEVSSSISRELKELRKALARLQQTISQGALASGPGRRRQPLKLCMVEGCGRKHAAKGLCKNHYQQWLNRKKKEGPSAAKPGSVRSRNGRKVRRARARR